MELVTASPEPGQHVPEPQGLVVAEGRRLQQARSNGLMLIPPSQVLPSLVLDAIGPDSRALLAFLQWKTSWFLQPHCCTEQPA